MELINPQPFVYFISAILVVIGVIIGIAVNMLLSRERIAKIKKFITYKKK
jgi:uncharacterized membrane protein (DUF106 family)